MPGSAFASSPARAAWDRSHQDGEGLEGAAQGGATVQRGAGPLAAALGLFLPLSSLPHAVWCCRILWGWGGGEMGDKYSQMPRARETRLCSPDSVNRVTLRLPRLAGQFQGRVPTLAAGWRGGLAGSGGYSEARNLRCPALCRPPGDGGRGEGVVGGLGPPGGSSRTPEGRTPRNGASSAVAARSPHPRDAFPPPRPSGGGGGGGGPQGTCPSWRLQRRTTSRHLGEVRAASPTARGRVGSDRCGDLAALGCPLRPFPRSPSAPVHLSGSFRLPSRGSGSPAFSSRSVARRHPRPPVSASL